MIAIAALSTALVLAPSALVLAPSSPKYTPRARTCTMGKTDDRLAELGITLPAAPAPLASYVPCVRSGNMLYLSGSVPFKEDGTLHAGKVSVEYSLEQAQACARTVGLQLIATLKANSDLDKAFQLSGIYCHWSGSQNKFDDCPTAHSWSGVANMAVADAAADGVGLTVPFQVPYTPALSCVHTTSSHSRRAADRCYGTSNVEPADTSAAFGQLATSVVVPSAHRDLQKAYMFSVSRTIIAGIWVAFFQGCQR